MVKLGEDNFWSSGKTGHMVHFELYYDFHPEKGLQNIDLEDGIVLLNFIILFLCNIIVI